MLLLVLREYYWSLPSWKAAKENGLVLGVNIVVWGLRWGSPGSQMANTWPLATGEMGKGEGNVHLAVLRQYYWTLFLLFYLFNSEVFKMKKCKYTIVLMTAGTFKKRYWLTI